MTQPTFNTIEGGGVTSAAGFMAGGIHAGFRANPERLDMALVEADELCAAAGTFTQNIFCAAPVMVSRAHLDNRGFGHARAVVINSGTANAATGSVGLDVAEKTAEIVANTVGCTAEDVLVASTGVIGRQLELAPFEEFVPVLHDQLHAAAGEGVVSGATAESGHNAACAIMTTDTVPKEVAVSYTSQAPGFEGITFTVGGMSKGSGMIMPNMATMIAVLTTDAPLTPAALHSALVAAVNCSFNKITVDSDTSTNDTCIALASGKAAPAGTTIEEGSAAYEEFAAALSEVAQRLARIMARDGEGATKLVTVTVTGAATEEEADMAARTVANSPLVKTAIYGHDANWGRIAGALGRSGAHFRQENVDIDIMEMPVLRAGLPVPFDEEEALRRFEQDEILLQANLGAGECQATIWTCDFSHDYVSINGDYRS